MKLRKTGVLVINLGTPDEPRRKDVARYLRQFLTDARVIDYPWLPRQLLVRGIIVPFRASSSSKLYKMLWTDEGSPLKFYGERVVAGLQERMGPDIPVALGMRYQNPSVASAYRELQAQGVTDLIVFPMFPQYASATTGSAFEEVLDVVRKEQVIPSIYRCDHRPWSTL